MSLASSRSSKWRGAHRLRGADLHAEAQFWICDDGGARRPNALRSDGAPRRRKRAGGVVHQSYPVLRFSISKGGDMHPDITAPKYFD
jgi:hypothetical protein